MDLYGSHRVYRADAPISTHRRPASCAEVDCEAYRLGWVTTVDPATDLGQRQGAYIASDRSRHAVPRQTPAGLVDFVYAPGQPCFAEHTVPVDRVPLLRVVEGGQVTSHTNVYDWLDDMHNHIDRVETERERG